MMDPQRHLKPSERFARKPNEELSFLTSSSSQVNNRQSLMPTSVTAYNLSSSPASANSYSNGNGSRESMIRSGTSPALVQRSSSPSSASMRTASEGSSPPFTNSRPLPQPSLRASSQPGSRNPSPLSSGSSPLPPPSRPMPSLPPGAAPVHSQSRNTVLVPQVTQPPSANQSFAPASPPPSFPLPAPPQRIPSLPLPPPPDSPPLPPSALDRKVAHVLSPPLPPLPSQQSLTAPQPNSNGASLNSSASSTNSYSPLAAFLGSSASSSTLPRPPPAPVPSSPYDIDALLFSPAPPPARPLASSTASATSASYRASILSTSTTSSTNSDFRPRPAPMLSRGLPVPIAVKAPTPQSAQSATFSSSPPTPMMEPAPEREKEMRMELPPVTNSPIDLMPSPLVSHSSSQGVAPSLPILAPIRKSKKGFRKQAKANVTTAIPVSKPRSRESTVEKPYTPTPVQQMEVRPDLSVQTNLRGTSPGSDTAVPDSARSETFFPRHSVRTLTPSPQPSSLNSSPGPVSQLETLHQEAKVRAMDVHPGRSSTPPLRRETASPQGTPPRPHRLLPTPSTRRSVDVGLLQQSSPQTSPEKRLPSAARGAFDESTQNAAWQAERGRPPVSVTQEVAAPEDRPARSHQPRLSTATLTQVPPPTVSSRTEPSSGGSRSSGGSSLSTHATSATSQTSADRDPSAAVELARKTVAAQQAQAHAQAQAAARLSQPVVQAPYIGKPRFELALTQFPKTILFRLLGFMKWSDFRPLREVSRKLRACVEQPDIKEKVLERYLGEFGYRTMPSNIRNHQMPNAPAPRLWQGGQQQTATTQNGLPVLTLHELDAFLIGAEFTPAEYAELAREHRKRPLDPRVARMVRASTRAWSKVVIRIRSQYEAGLMSTVRRGSVATPVYRDGRAAVMRVWVPLKQGSWMDDDEVIQCEREMWRSGIWPMVRKGDLIWNMAAGDFGNEGGLLTPDFLRSHYSNWGTTGKLISDSKFLRDLAYSYDAVGHIPVSLNHLNNVRWVSLFDHSPGSMPWPFLPVTGIM